MMNSPQAPPANDHAAQLLNELRPYHQQSYRWALTCCDGLREEAEDLLQDVYLDILSEKLRYRRESTARVWLFGVIRVRAISRQRKLKRRLQLLTLHIQSRLHALSTLTPTDTSVSYLKQTQQREVLKAIASLSPQQRKIIELVFYHELTLAESAQVCTISLGSARTHYKRGKRNLQIKLQHLTDELGPNTSSHPLAYGAPDDR